MKAALVLAVLFWLSPAFPVSRVGTGKVTNDENGFALTIPPNFPASFVSPQNDVKLEGLTGFRSPFNRPFMYVFLLSNKQPEWQGRSDRGEFQTEFTVRGWTQVPHAEPCVEYWRKDNPTARTIVLSWGNGFGVIMTAPAESAQDLTQMAETLALAPGFCSWN